jgi:hypothetical protein
MRLPGGQCLDVNVALDLLLNCRCFSHGCPSPRYAADTADLVPLARGCRNHTGAVTQHIGET